MSALTAKEFQDILESSPIPFETYNYDSHYKRIPGSEHIEYSYIGVASEGAEGWKYEEIGWREFVEIADNKAGVSVEGLGHLTVVEDFGGEGQGDQYYFVLKLVRENEDDQFFLMPGYHASYDGGYYDGTFQEVKPVERVVTFYE